MANGKSFWSNPSLDPKRQYRFLVNFGNLGADEYIAKSVKKPSFQVGVSKHQFLSHEFKYPTSVKWNDVQITLVDPGSPDMTATLLAALATAGYKYPSAYPTGGEPGKYSTVSKARFSGTGDGGSTAGALGQILIKQIDAEGNVIEEWTLKNSFISTVEFGQLSYASEDMVDITMTVVYDWATLDRATPSQAGTNKALPPK